MWVIGSDCVAKYRVDPGLETSGWDWIALFRVRRAQLARCRLAAVGAEGMLARCVHVGRTEWLDAS